MRNATFYHAGCPVCVAAEQDLLHLLNPRAVHVQVVHLGDEPGRIAEAEAAGVASVPALVLNADTEQPSVLHVNHGADLVDLKA